MIPSQSHSEITSPVLPAAPQLGPSPSYLPPGLPQPRSLYDSALKPITPPRVLQPPELYHFAWPPVQPRTPHDQITNGYGSSDVTAGSLYSQPGQSLYNTNFGMNQSHPQQTFNTKTQQRPVYTQQGRESGRTFDGGAPRPSVSYNGYVPLHRDGTFRFPGSTLHSHDPGSPLPTPAIYYPTNTPSSTPSEYVPSVISVNPPSGVAESPPNWLGYPRSNEDTHPISSTDEPPRKHSENSPKKDVCPNNFSGLMVHSDCSKFLSCAHGRTFVMECGPGTR